jgi:4-carboxymuconolactone decarboxylase
MSRLPPLVYEELTPDQQKAFQLIAGPRDGVVNGPFPAWIRLPKLCLSIQSVSDILRTQTNLKPCMFEVITLVVARGYNAGYMWGAHAGFAMKHGLPERIVDDINHGRHPAFADPRDQVIFDVAECLAAGKLLPGKLYDNAIELLGVELLIEVSTDVGFYNMIATVLNTFDVEQKPETIPLA